MHAFWCYIHKHDNKQHGNKHLGVVPISAAVVAITRSLAAFAGHDRTAFLSNRKITPERLK